MTTKRPRFGDGPARSGAGDDDRTRVAGAPMPLVTQPMIAMEPPPGTDPVSVRQLAHTVSQDQVAMRQRPPTAPPATALVASQQGAMSPQMAARQPPEIGLTQHHLPDDAPPDGRLVLLTEPDSDRAASYRVLRHHLLEQGAPQVCVVTSPKPGDGKTTVAVNLALALAECGRAKVLLCETHLRRPQLAQVFRFSPPWCFAEQLAAHRHQPMLPWGFVDIPQLWLHVAAINPRIEQNQLLDAPAFAIAMERLRLGGYDHIVIDCPPVVGSADVNLIQDAADGTLIVMRGKKNTARDLRGAIEQLSPARVLGTVLIEG